MSATAEKPPSIWPYITIASKQYLFLIIKTLFASILLNYSWNNYIAVDFKLNLLSFPTCFLICFMYLYATEYLIRLIKSINTNLTIINGDTLLIKNYLYYIAVMLEKKTLTVDNKVEVCNNDTTS